MRGMLDRDRLERFLQELGRRLRVPTRLYLVGGASAVLERWRDATVDIDFTAEPESRELFEALPDLKRRLDVNVEIASPAHFVPEVPGWRERSRWVGSWGKLHVYHYDFMSQALAKLERGHAQDLADVERMLEGGLVDAATLLAQLAAIEGELVRYPAVDPESYRAKVEAALLPWLSPSVSEE